MNLNQCVLMSTFTTSNSFNFRASSTSSCGAPTENNTLPTPTWTRRLPRVWRGGRRGARRVFR